MRMTSSGSRTFTEGTALSRQGLRATAPGFHQCATGAAIKITDTLVLSGGEKSGRSWAEQQLEDRFPPPE